MYHGNIVDKTVEYDVFISHAGPDKHTMAIPLREMLQAKGIRAFVDEKDLGIGDHAPKIMTQAMENAVVGVFILSPEYVARKWPMRELFCFQRRVREAENKCQRKPTLVPVFYRLSTDECNGTALWSLCENSKSPFLDPKNQFQKRKALGEEEADLQRIEEALYDLGRTVGIRNDNGVTNEGSKEMAQKRNVYLEEISEKLKVVFSGRRNPVERKCENCDRIEGKGCSWLDRDNFRAVYDVPKNLPHVKIDLNSKDERDEPVTLEGRVKSLLLERPQNVLNIVAISGISGVGKTATTRHLANDKAVKERFPDGMIFVQLGQDRTVQSCLRQLCNAVENAYGKDVAEKLRGESNSVEVVSAVAACFWGKSILVILDDVWEENEVEKAFLHQVYTIVSGGRDSALLFTTRELQISQEATERAVKLTPKDKMGARSKEILFTCANRPPEDVEHGDVSDSVDMLLEACGGLAVALVVTGKGVGAIAGRLGSNKHDAWKMYSSNKEECTRRAVKGNGTEEYPSLAQSVMVTLRILSGRCSLQMRKMFAQLSILEKQMWAPEGMLQKLWKLTCKDTQTVINMLADVSLVEIETRETEGGRVIGIRLHDLILDVAVIIAEDYGGAEQRHRSLLDAYEPQEMLEGSRRWWSEEIEEDMYFHKNLSRHLMSAGQRRELVELLLQPKWAYRQLEVCGARQLKEDFERGSKPFHESGERKAESPLCGQVATNLEGSIGLDSDVVQRVEGLKVIEEAYTLGYAFIVKNPGEVFFQFCGRLVEVQKKNEVAAQYLRDIETCAERPWAHPLNGFLASGGGALQRIILPDLHVCSMASSMKEECMFFGSLDGFIYVVDVTSGEITRSWDAHISWVTSLFVSENANKIVSGCENGDVGLWSLCNGHPLYSFRQHSSLVKSVAMIGNDQQVVSAGESVVKVFDISREETLCELQEEVNCIGVSDCGRSVFFGEPSGVFWMTAVTDGSREDLTGYHGSRDLLKIQLTHSEALSETIRRISHETTISNSSRELMRGESFESASITSSRELVRRKIFESASENSSRELVWKKGFESVSVTSSQETIRRRNFESASVNSSRRLSRSESLYDFIGNRIRSSTPRPSRSYPASRRNSGSGFSNQGSSTDRSFSRAAVEFAGWIRSRTSILQSSLIPLIQRRFREHSRTNDSDQSSVRQVSESAERTIVDRARKGRFGTSPRERRQNTVTALCRRLLSTGSREVSATGSLRRPRWRRNPFQFCRRLRRPIPEPSQENTSNDNMRPNELVHEPSHENASHDDMRLIQYEESVAHSPPSHRLLSGNSFRSDTSRREYSHSSSSNGSIDTYVFDSSLIIYSNESSYGHDSQSTAFCTTDCRVNCIAFMCHEKIVVGGLEDGTVRMWDRSTKDHLRTIHVGSGSAVKDVAISDDEKRLATYSDNGIIRVWNLESYREVCAPMSAPSFHPRTLCFFKGGDCLVSCAWDGTVKAWDVNCYTEELGDSEHDGEVKSVAFFGGGTHVVCSSSGGTLRVWDSITGIQVGEARSTNGSVLQSIAVFKDGKRAVFGSNQGTLEIWDLTEFKMLRVLEGHSNEVWSVALTPGENKVVSGSLDGTIGIWDLNTANGRPEFLGGDSLGVFRVYVSNDGRRVISVGENKVSVWDMERFEFLRTVERDKCHLMPWHRIMALAGESFEDPPFVVWIEMLGTQIMAQSKGGEEKVLGSLETFAWDYAVSEDMSRLCVGLANNRVGLMKIER